MSTRYFIDEDARGDLAVWRDNGDEYPTALLYKYDVDKNDDDNLLWDLIAEAVGK
jgi:hypothetical protein